MILMTTFTLGEVPFRSVNLHGLVRDEQGRKMSKSLDNIIDPLDVSAKFGTDAVRLSLVVGSTPGQDKNLSESKIEGYRNFTNKLWNIARFVLTQVESVHSVSSVESKTVADELILARLDDVILEVTRKLELFELSAAAETLRDFTWGEFADWYLEIAKIEKGKDDILLYILERLLTLWHPFMPFVTEEIWKYFDSGSLLMVHSWPVSKGHSATEARGLIEELKAIVTVVRNLKSEHKVAPSARLAVTIVCHDLSHLEPLRDLLCGLARIETLTITTNGAKPDGAVASVLGSIQVFVHLDGLIDHDKSEQFQEELISTQNYLETLQSNFPRISRESAPKGCLGLRDKQSEAR